MLTCGERTQYELNWERKKEKSRQVGEAAPAPTSSPTALARRMMACSSWRHFQCVFRAVLSPPRWPGQWSSRERVLILLTRGTSSSYLSPSPFIKGVTYFCYKDEGTRPPVGKGTPLCHAAGWREPTAQGQPFHFSNSQYALPLRLGV